MYAVEMLNVTKIFGKFKANDNITLQVKQGEIHALLGENGAGKSTLMNLLFGFYQLDGGEIKINGKVENISSPNVANELKIGMVHQHFKLVKPFTVAQNITLGSELKSGLKVDQARAVKEVQAIIDKYQFNLDAKTKVADLTVGEQQKVEILKMLYKEANILIFDEPTGALTPGETKELLEIILKLKAEGKTIVVITHKLKEIKAVAERCTVIRRGKSIDTVNVADYDEQELANLMVGRQVSFEVDKVEKEFGEPILQVKDINMFNVIGSQTLTNVSFELKKGEILGVSGVDGNGQTEIVEAITGLKKVKSGSIKFKNTELTELSIRDINELNISHIPQDRHRHGLVLDYSVAENSVLKRYFKEPYSSKGIINKSEFSGYSDKLIEENDIRTPHGSLSMARDLSGGNQQKLIIAREIYENPEMLIAVQPTRGVDVGAIENIHNQILEQRALDKGILLVSLELDEILKLSDRIAVMHDGELMGILDAKDATQEKVGILMAGGSLNE